jgi:hypothetical protein
MKKNRFTQNELLDQAILELQVKRNHQKLVLKNQANATLQSFNPLNLLKNAFSEVKNSPDMKRTLFQAAVSFAGGLLSKKILIGKTNSTFKNIVGYLIQFGMTKFIAKEVTTDK